MLYWKNLRRLFRLDGRFLKLVFQVPILRKQNESFSWKSSLPKINSPKNLEDISVRLAYVLGWPTDIMFSSSGSKLSNPNSISVNIVISSKTYNNAYVNEAVNSVIERGLSNTLVALTLEDGRTLNI